MLHLLLSVIQQSQSHIGLLACIVVADCEPVLTIAPGSITTGESPAFTMANLDWILSASSLLHSPGERNISTKLRCDLEREPQIN